MARQCYLCKVYKHHASDLSFHRLPADPIRRKIWLSLLGFKENHQLPKRVDICSKHFSENEFIHGTGGITYLKPYAAPLPVHSLFDPPEYMSTDTPVRESCSERRKILKSEDDIITAASSSYGDSHVIEQSKFADDISYLAGPSNRELASSSMVSDEETDISVVTKANISLLATLKDSEVAVETTESSSIQFRRKLAVVGKQKKRKRRYVEDLSTDDFSSPKKAKKHFRSLKDNIVSLRKKIRSLQGTVRYYKKRVKSSNSLLKLFKDKSYMRKTSGTIIRAPLSGSSLQIIENMLKRPRPRNIVCH